MFCGKMMSKAKTASLEGTTACSRGRQPAVGEEKLGLSPGGATGKTTPVSERPAYIRGLPLLIFLVALLGVAGSARAHPDHVSIAEAEWNAETSKLEVALKLHANDLERALRQRHKRPIVLETEKEIDRLILDYLDQVFVVKAADGKRAELKWVGKEIAVKESWLYFEVPLAGGPEGATFSHRIFFELLDDQVNTINLRVGQRRATLTFTADRAERKLRFSD